MTNASSGDASTLPVDDIIGSVIHGVSAVCLLLALVTWVTLRLTDRLVTRRYLVLTFTIVASFLFHTIVLSSRLRAVSVAMATNPHPGTLNAQRPSPSPPFWTTTPRYGRTRRSGRPPMLKRALFDLEARAQPLLLRRAARSLKEDVYLRALGGDFVSDDALSNNVLNGDVLTDDALSDDVLSGDVLRGDVSRSLRFKPHSVRNKSSKFRFAELMRETHQSENGVSAISGGSFSVYKERETHHGVDANGVSNNVYPNMQGKHQFVQHAVDANGVSNNVYPNMQGKHQLVQHFVDVNGVSNNVYPKMRGKHQFVQHAVDASGRVYPKMRGNHQLGHHGMDASKVSLKLTRGKRQSPGSRNNDRDYVPGRAPPSDAPKPADGKRPRQKRQSPGSRNNDRDYVPGRAPPSDAPKPADGKRRRRPKNRGEKKQSTEPPREVSSDDDGSWVTLCQAGRAFYLLSDLSVYSFLFSMSLYYTLVVLGNPLTFNRLVTMFLFGLGVPVAFVTFTILMYVFLPAKAGFGSSCAVDAIVDEFHWATTAPKLLCVLLSLCLMTVSTYGFWRLHVPALNASSETFYAKQGVLKMLALLMVLSLAELYFLVTEYQRLYGLATTRFVVYFSTACCGAKGLALAILFCFADSEILHSTCCPPTTFYDGEPWLRAPPDHIRGRGGGGGGGGSNDSVKRWEDEDLAGNFDTVDAEQLSRWEEAERRRYDLDLQIPRVGGLRRWDEEEGWRVEEPVPIYRRITKDEQDVMRRGAGFEEPQPQQWMAPQITSTPHHPQLMSRRPQSPLGGGFEVTQNPQLSFSQRSTTPKGSIGETPTLRVGERAPTPRSAEGVRLGERAPTPRNTEGIRVGERAPTPRSAEGVRLGERAPTPRSAEGVRLGERAPTPRSADGVTPALRVGARSPTPRSAEGVQGSLKLRSGDRTPTPKYGERPQTPKTQDGLQQFPPLPRIGGITRWQPDVMSTSAHSREGSETMPVADDTRKAGDRTPTPAELKLAARDRGERTEDAAKGIQEEGGGRGGAVSPDKTGNQGKTGHHHHHHSQRPKSDDRSSEGTRRALGSGAKRAPKRAWKDQEDTREWADNEEEDEEVAADEGGGNEDEESTSGMNRMRNATPRHQNAPEFDLEFSHKSDHVSKAAQEKFENAKSNYTSNVAQGQFENDDDDDLASAPSSALNDDSGESAATVLMGDFAGGVYPDDGDVYPDDSQADSEQLPPVDVAGYTPGSPRTPRRFEVTHEFWQPPQAQRTDRDPHAAKRHRREYENTRAVVAAHAPGGDFQGSKAVPTEYPEIAGVYLPRELQWMQGRNREVVPCMADFQSGREVGRDFQGTHGAREGVPGTEFQSTHGSREARAREFGGTPTAKGQGREYHPETVINAGYLPRELQGSPLQPGVIRELTPITRDLLGAGRGAYGDVNYGDVDPTGESEGGGNHEDSSTTTIADGAALTDLEYAQGVMDVLQAYKTTPDGGEHHTVQPWHADPDKPHFYTSDDWVI